MTQNQIFQYALVRGVPGTYDRCIKPGGQYERIDVALAREQHGQYRLALQDLGLTVVRIDTDERFPDCCFIEDTAIVAGETAIISRMGSPSRAMETVYVKKTISNYKKTREILHPGIIDGGDVLRIGNKIYIGLSERTNQHAVGQVKALVQDGGYEVMPIEIRDTLHLKTACTYLGQGCVVLASGCFDQTIFSEYKKIVVPGEEAYCANCLAVNGKVLIPGGYPRTRELIEKEGFETIEVDISEFKKGNGGLTCLSIIF